MGVRFPRAVFFARRGARAQVLLAAVYISRDDSALSGAVLFLTEARARRGALGYPAENPSAVAPLFNRIIKRSVDGMREVEAPQHQSVGGGAPPATTTKRAAPPPARPRRDARAAAPPQRGAGDLDVGHKQAQARRRRGVGRPRARSKARAVVVGAQVRDEPLYGRPPLQRVAARYHGET